MQESARGVSTVEKTKPKVLVYQKNTGKIISGVCYVCVCVCVCVIKL